jgi:hypothetical protein
MISIIPDDFVETAFNADYDLIVSVIFRTVIVDSYTDRLSGIHILTYKLKSIADGKNENQIAERLDGNNKPVRICIDTSNPYPPNNQELFWWARPDGKEYHEKFDIDQ